MVPGSPPGAYKDWKHAKLCMQTRLNLLNVFERPEPQFMIFPLQKPNCDCQIHCQVQSRLASIWHFPLMSFNLRTTWWILTFLVWMIDTHTCLLLSLGSISIEYDRLAAITWGASNTYLLHMVNLCYLQAQRFTLSQFLSISNVEMRAVPV